MKFICPYCGSKMDMNIGNDGNPYQNQEPKNIICKICGNKIPCYHPQQLRMIKQEKTEQKEFTQLKIHASSQGGGVVRQASKIIPLQNGTFFLGDEYPFGRFDIDAKPPFQLSSITIKNHEIEILGESILVYSLPKILIKKCVAYGYQKVPFEEVITVTISIFK